MRNEPPDQEFLIPLTQSVEIEMRKFLSLAVVAGALLVSACNTVAGVGEDVSSAGSTVSGAANDAAN